MNVLTALDLHFLVKEFQELISAKIEKIYQPAKTEFMVVLHIPNQGKKILKINFPGHMYLTEFKGKTPEQPSQFCLFLRKYLSNARIRKIEMLGFERIVDVLLEKKEGKYHLYIELFSQGNIILTTEDSVIKSALVTKRWKDRTIRGNSPYEYPKREHNALLIKADEFKTLLNSTDKESIVKSLALDLGLGGRYSEELCLRAGVDKERKRLKPEEIDALYKELDKLRKQKICARAIMKDNKLKDVVPIELKLYEGFDVNEFNTFSSALGTHLTQAAQKDQEVREDARLNKEHNRLKKVIAEQEVTIVNLKKSMKLNQRKGELLYEKYTEVTELLKELKKIPAKELKKHPKVLQANPKERTVVVEI